MPAPVTASPQPAGSNWTSNTMLFIYICALVVIVVLAAVLLLRKTVRTRLSTERRIAADPDINEWLVVFSWTNKILYLPAIAASLLAALLTFIRDSGGALQGLSPALIGAVWFAVFLLNFVVEEYEVNLKLAIIVCLAVGFLGLLLHLVGQVLPFLRLFRHVRIVMSGWAYLCFALAGLLAVLVSWYRGLFYYVALTPNYMNLQWGPTESGEQVKRDQYKTTVDTGDFVERLFGFGRIVITFLDQRRPPIQLLVWGIGRKAAMVESLSGTFSIDRDGKSLSAQTGRDPKDDG
jgi:hypothetical protein